MAVVWKSLATGIRAKEHSTRKHGVKPDLYFVLRFRVDGVAKQESLGWASEGWTLAKARAELAKLKEAKRTGEGEATLAERREAAKVKKETEKAKPTVALLWETYDAAHQGRASHKPDTRNIRHSLERFGNKTPDQVRTAHIDTMRRELEAQGYAAQTVKHILGVLRRIIRYGAQRGLCSMPDISKLHFEMPKIDNIKTECLTPEQVKALFIALDNDPDQNLASMMRLALATGMRRGALLSLEWRDIDFKRGLITLRGETAKSGKTTTIPMSSTAKEILLGVEMMGSQFLFPNPETGKKRVEIRRFTDRIAKAANLPKGFRPLHGLRHTYASWLASSGKTDLFTLQRLLTHGSPMMTQRYAHLADEALKSAACIIDECMAAAVNAEPVQVKEASSKLVPFVVRKKG